MIQGMGTPKSKLWNDFLYFSELQLWSRDIDPVYPVLGELLANRQPETQAWWVWLYVAYYDLGSTLIALQHHAGPEPLCTECSFLPTGVERRNLRGGKIARHIEDSLEVMNGRIHRWLSGYAAADDWSMLQERLQQVWGNGRWAAYKTGEVLQKVLQWSHIVPADMGNAFSSGPRHGLDLFFPPLQGNSVEVVAHLDRRGEKVYKRLVDAGAPVADIAEVETLLCDFNSMVKGNYYPGRDIDELQESLLRAGSDDRFAHRSDQALEPAWKARKHAFPSAYLGELNGWTGVDKDRKKHYARTGEVLAR